MHSRRIDTCIFTEKNHFRFMKKPHLILETRSMQHVCRNCISCFYSVGVIMKPHKQTQEQESCWTNFFSFLKDSCYCYTICWFEMIGAVRLHIWTHRKEKEIKTSSIKIRCFLIIKKLRFALYNSTWISIVFSIKTIGIFSYGEDNFKK